MAFALARGLRLVHGVQLREPAEHVVASHDSIAAAPAAPLYPPARVSASGSLAGWILRRAGWTIVGAEPDVAALRPGGLAPQLELGRVGDAALRRALRRPAALGGQARGVPWSAGSADARAGRHRGSSAPAARAWWRPPRRRSAAATPLALAIAPDGTRSARDYWRSGFYHIARAADVPLVLSFLDWGTRRAGIGPTLTPHRGRRARTWTASARSTRAWSAGIPSRRPESACARRTGWSRIDDSESYAGGARARAERVGDATDPLNLTWLGPAEGSEPKGRPPGVGPFVFGPRRTAMERTKFTGETATQMHYARKGVVTPEMARVAEREQAEPEFVRDEVARGRMVIPANVNHASLEPMAHRHRRALQDQREHRQLRRSTRTSSEELEKLHTGRPLRRRHGDGPLDRRRHRRDPRRPSSRPRPVPIGTVPIYQAVQQVNRVEDLTADDLIDIIEHQAQQGVDYMTVHCGVLCEHLPLVAAPHHGHRLARRRAARPVDGPPPASRTRSTRTTTRSSRSRASTTSRSRSGDGLRPGCLADASRRRAVRRAQDAGRAHAQGLGEGRAGDGRGPGPRARSTRSR